jgi:hypothetical protein
VDDAATMVKIIMPVSIRVFRAVDKNVFLFMRMNGHYANVCPLFRLIDNLNGARMDIDAFNGFTGKRRAGGAYIKHQPLTVRCPGVNIGELMVARRASDLFHADTLMPYLASG